MAASGLSAELVLQAIKEALERGLSDENALMEMAAKRGGRPATLIYSAFERSIP